MPRDYRQMFDLKGRVAMVTGAGQGMGRAIAPALGAFGAGAIIVNDCHTDRAEAVVVTCAAWQPMPLAEPPARPILSMAATAVRKAARAAPATGQTGEIWE